MRWHLCLSRYAECRYAESCFAEYRYAEGCFAKCRYAEWRYTQCRGVMFEQGEMLINIFGEKYNFEK